jgi:AcrR family transcriptional regulator
VLAAGGAPARTEDGVATTAIEHLAQRAVERKVAERRSEYGAEMRRIVDCTFSLIERTGTLDPSMREILAEAGLSTQTFYRYFSSKDELMFALLDEGRRRLVDTLLRRMARASSPSDQVRAWIEGVLAQSVNEGAAARTRPWVLSEHRLAELFPEQQQVSVDLLVELLVDPIMRLQPSRGKKRSPAPMLATMVYRLTFAELHAQLAAGTRPNPRESSLLVEFCLRGVSA